ncbi:aldolase [Shigella sonnei]|nr:aldolase [Shigella sonnei]
MNALLTNPFKERLRKGEVQIGLWLSSTTSLYGRNCRYFRL